ncbi:hypothetical protein HLH26_15795 [Gluconacetobacter sp. 1b LMG 1731]|uniref:Uncharacterized protein n=1 Tax=Gluconacetobacter dulcium TaxID=2729096 RepID=A0A7W4IN57_9PROT|nr:hypothetical protein [Gluconacetobacter dulcium]MBB2165966.1 hypothetical protein [Gluconacetobacter dulcium]MBB2195103.1 hypothetical protein [Gluconacetobacter dulcium]
MSARRPNAALETAVIPRAELDAQNALLALADRALGLVIDGGPHGEMALLDLERAYILARTVIRNGIDSRPVRFAPTTVMRRPNRPRRACIGSIAS